MDRIELADVQFYGWGLLNRAALMPTRPDSPGSGRRSTGGVPDWPTSPLTAGDEPLTALVWVVPDYFDGVAKPCVGGGAVSLTVTPDGTALPCPAAGILPDLDPPNVRDHALAWIRDHAAACTRCRGTGWMTEACRTCSRRAEDFGGCRCQAYALTGDATRTDPACRLPPDHGLVRGLTEDAGTSPAADTFRPRGRQRRAT
ncbi:SPASM domain-containing protein [Streptomyces sp. NPDC046385]|uniref:SPASM domain-containing protein n=1 Tax=unclassified Streptomyces TaxID=2593676 RepID=UPI0033E48B7A